MKLICTGIRFGSLRLSYHQRLSSYGPIRPKGAEVERIIKKCLNMHFHIKLLCADLQFGFLRLSTIEKFLTCSLDQRELRNS